MENKKKSMNIRKIKKQVKGITLIALVVTIIVLLILAGIALNLTIGENGIFARAQNAVNVYEQAATNEQMALEEGADLIEDYLNGNGGGTALGDITGYETSNTVTQDKYGNPIKVPAGFKVVNPNDDVTKGIIIEDVSANGEGSTTIGSQFVWIPVGDVITDEEGNTTKITLGRYNFGSDGTPSPYSGSSTEDTKDSHNSDYKNVIAKDIEDFINKATNKSHGYYIGRYEAGDAKATTEARTGRRNYSNPNNPITCKSGVYPYNYVNQGDASTLAREMYNSNNFDSDLINSYAWDTAIVFIQTFSGDKDYSRQSGANTNGSFQRCGESILHADVVDEGDESHDIRCNIYDMAGNTYEWTTETRPDANSPCLRRGGHCYIAYAYTSNRTDHSPTDSNKDYSFRPILYL